MNHCQCLACKTGEISRCNCHGCLADSTAVEKWVLENKDKVYPRNIESARNHLLLRNEARHTLPPIDQMTVEDLRRTCKIYRGALLEINADSRFGGWECDADCPRTASAALLQDMYSGLALEIWSRTP